MFLVRLETIFHCGFKQLIVYPMKTCFAAINLAFLLIFLTGCASTNPMRTSDTFNLQGHRGARGLLPENSIPSFIRAVELGVPTIELDVVVSKDNQVVVSHDPWFSAEICSLPSGDPVPAERQREYRLYEMNYEEIAGFDCGSRGNPHFPRQQKLSVSKPLLRETILAIERYVNEHNLPPVHYNVEAKSNPDWDGVMTPEPDAFVPLIHDVLTETGVLARSNIQSFDIRILQAVRKIDATLTLALLVGNSSEHDLSRNLDQLGFTPEIYSPHYQLVDETLVEEVHRRGMKIIPWTVNTLEEMVRLKELGVDGIITDYPDLGKELL